MKKKGLFALLSGICLVLILVALPLMSACAPAAPTPPAAEVVIKYGHVVPVFMSPHTAATVTKEYVERMSGGKIVIEVFPAGQLGGAIAIAEQVQAGTVEMCNVGIQEMSTFVPELSVYSLPFVFPGRDVAIEVLKSEKIRAKFFPLVEAKGFIPLGFASAEPRDFTNKLRPVRTPEDVKGIKIRVMEVPILVDTWKALGADPVTMPFPEVYGGLQQGVIDGQENPIDVSNIMKFNEITKYGTYLGHLYQAQLVSYNASAWAKLTEDQKRIIRAGVAVGEKACWEHSVISIADGERIAVEKYGVKIEHLTPAEYKLWKDAVAPVWVKWSEEISPEYYDFFVREVEKLSRQLGY